MQMFPAFDTAMDDESIRGEPLRVYLHLSRQLDFLTYRKKKATVVALEMKMNDRTAAWALHRLCERGYLVRGPKDGKVFSYRLVWSLESPTTATNASA